MPITREERNRAIQKLQSDVADYVARFILSSNSVSTEEKEALLVRIGALLQDRMSDEKDKLSDLRDQVITPQLKPSTANSPSRTIRNVAERSVNKAENLFRKLKGNSLQEKKDKTPSESRESNDVAKVKEVAQEEQKEGSEHIGSSEEAGSQNSGQNEIHATVGISLESPKKADDFETALRNMKEKMLTHGEETILELESKIKTAADFLEEVGTQELSTLQKKALEGLETQIAGVKEIMRTLKKESGQTSESPDPSSDSGTPDSQQSGPNSPGLTPSPIHQVQENSPSQGGTPILLEEKSETPAPEQHKSNSPVEKIDISVQVNLPDTQGKTAAGGEISGESVKSVVPSQSPEPSAPKNAADASSASGATTPGLSNSSLTSEQSLDESANPGVGQPPAAPKDEEKKPAAGKTKASTIQELHEKMVGALGGEGFPQEGNALHYYFGARSKSGKVKINKPGEENREIDSLADTLEYCSKISEKEKDELLSFGFLYQNEKGHYSYLAVLFRNGKIENPVHLYELPGYENDKAEDKIITDAVLAAARKMNPKSEKDKRELFVEKALIKGEVKGFHGDFLVEGVINHLRSDKNKKSDQKLDPGSQTAPQQTQPQAPSQDLVEHSHVSLFYLPEDKIIEIFKKAKLSSISIDGDVQVKPGAKEIVVDVTFTPEPKLTPSGLTASSPISTSVTRKELFDNRVKWSCSDPKLSPEQFYETVAKLSLHSSKENQTLRIAELRKEISQTSDPALKAKLQSDLKNLEALKVDEIAIEVSSDDADKKTKKQRTEFNNAELTDRQFAAIKAHFKAGYTRVQFDGKDYYSSAMSVTTKPPVPANPVAGPKNAQNAAVATPPVAALAPVPVAQTQEAPKNKVTLSLVPSGKQGYVDAEIVARVLKHHNVEKGTQVKGHPHHFYGGIVSYQEEDGKFSLACESADPETYKETEFCSISATLSEKLKNNRGRFTVDFILLDMQTADGHFTKLTVEVEGKKDGVDKRKVTITSVDTLIGDGSSSSAAHSAILEALKKDSSLKELEIPASVKRVSSPFPQVGPTCADRVTLDLLKDYSPTFSLPPEGEKIRKKENERALRKWFCDHALEAYGKEIKILDPATNNHGFPVTSALFPAASPATPAAETEQPTNLGGRPSGS